jgi:plasmid stabilization system protein ParE
VPHPDLDLDIPPLLTASVLLAARQFALASGISWPGIEDILAATGASPEEAHEIEDALLDQLAALAVMVNRQTPPPDLAGEDHSADLIGLAVEMVRFIKRNPGCAQSGTHERYTDCFRRFVLELRWRYCDVMMAEFAAAIDVPQGTVEDWLRGGRRGVDASTRATYQRATRGARARVA